MHLKNSIPIQDMNNYTIISMNSINLCAGYFLALIG